MSRIHDALRKAGQDAPPPKPAAARKPLPPPADDDFGPGALAVTEPETLAATPAAAVMVDESGLDNLEDIIVNAPTVVFNPLSEALVVNPLNPRESPAEEFRSLRTRLNHLQTVQPLHTLVVTSASPAEGKSFTATNLAITQAQLADKRILLADFDFRRPNIDKTFQIDCSPGITDYLQGKAALPEIIRRVEGTNLFLLTAGDAVTNPLELLNLKECRALLDGLRAHFDWVILDSPPLLFAADANLLSTMCDGTVLVVRIGATTFDSVTRALQSLCENNVLGIVVNGARRGELYSKYTYYHDYYYDREKDAPVEKIERQALVAADE
jgi:receptor protein-tyrosine kinase